MSAVSAAVEIEQIAGEVRRCTECDLCYGATNGVPGEGDSSARIMFIGEAPGWREDELGRPFVGPAGKFLDELLTLAGLTRSSVFITNVVKHRPPGNRDPMPDEIVACASFLDRQIAAIDPEVIVTLGRFSMAKWFEGERISRIHGQPRLVAGRTIVPMFHPAAALHQGSLRGTIEEDFRKLPRILAEVERKREANATSELPPLPDPEQMSLFD